MSNKIPDYIFEDKKIEKEAQYQLSDYRGRPIQKNDYVSFANTNDWPTDVGVLDLARKNSLEPQDFLRIIASSSGRIFSTSSDGTAEVVVDVPDEGSVSVVVPGVILSGLTASAKHESYEYCIFRGEIQLFCGTEVECWEWLHNKTSFSVMHALAHEDYSLRPAE